jgi:hypothetical protein
LFSAQVVGEAGCLTAVEADSAVEQLLQVASSAQERL